MPTTERSFKTTSRRMIERIFHLGKKNGEHENKEFTSEEREIIKIIERNGFGITEKTRDGDTIFHAELRLVSGHKRLIAVFERNNYADGNSSKELAVAEMFFHEGKRQKIAISSAQGAGRKPEITRSYTVDSVNTLQPTQEYPFTLSHDFLQEIVHAKIDDLGTQDSFRKTSLAVEQEKMQGRDIDIAFPAKQ